MAGLFLLGHLNRFPFWGNPWGGTGTPVHYWFEQIQVAGDIVRSTHGSCVLPWVGWLQ